MIFRKIIYNSGKKLKKEQPNTANCMCLNRMISTNIQNPRVFLFTNLFVAWRWIFFDRRHISDINTLDICWHFKFRSCSQTKRHQVDSSNSFDLCYLLKNNCWCVDEIGHKWRQLLSKIATITMASAHTKCNLILKKIDIAYVYQNSKMLTKSWKIRRSLIFDIVTLRPVQFLNCRNILAKCTKFFWIDATNQYKYLWNYKYSFWECMVQLMINIVEMKFKNFDTSVYSDLLNWFNWMYFIQTKPTLKKYVIVTIVFTQLKCLYLNLIWNNYNHSINYFWINKEINKQSRKDDLQQIIIYGKLVKLVWPMSSSTPTRLGKKSLHLPSRRMSQVLQCKEPPNSKTWRKSTGMTSKPCSLSKKLIMSVSPASQMILLADTENKFIDNQREDWHITGCSCFKE